MAKTSNGAQKAQELANQLASQRAASAKKQRYIFAGIIGGVLVAAVAVVVAIFIFNPNSEAGQMSAASDLAEKGEGPTSVWAPDGSITISKNGVGADKAIKGVPTVDIYNDFICPSCAAFERTYGETLQQFMTDGTANIRFHPLAWLDNTSPQCKSDGKTATGQTYAYATRAAAAAFYVGEKAPDKYYDFMMAMYNPSNQPPEGCEYTQEKGSNEAIAKIIVSAGISDTIAKAAVGLADNAVSPDWAKEFSTAAARVTIPGTQAGPYVRYAQKIGSLVASKGEIRGTPAVFITDVKGTQAKYDVPAGSVEKFVAQVKAAK